MDQMSNDAMRLRRIVEDLGIMAEQYNETGQLEERDQIEEVRESVGALCSLPEVEDDLDLAEDCG